MAKVGSWDRLYTSCKARLFPISPFAERLPISTAILLCPLSSPECWHWASKQLCLHQCLGLQCGWKGPQSTETLPDSKSSCKTSVGQQCHSEKSETLSTSSLCISPGLHSPGRFVEGNCANVEFLDLINGANGEGAVIGQCQTGKKACSLE